MTNQTQDQNWANAILDAITRLKKVGWDTTNNSRRYDVQFENESFPPKVVFATAADLYAEKFPDNNIPVLSGGKKTNEFLQKMGFDIVEKQQDQLAALINKYKAYIKNGGLQDEIYKWKLLYQYRGRPNINADNLKDEIKSVNFANLIYPVAQAVINHIAAERPEEYKKCFETLFDERMPLQDRVSFFNAETLKVYRQIVPQKKFSHHQDERTMSTFLTYHNPEKYTFYKDSFYKKLTSLLGIKAEKAGKKLTHYYALVDQIIDDYIKDDLELTQSVKSLMPAMTFSDENYKILAQDILYQGLDKNFGEGKKYWRIGTTDEENSYWDEMKLENKISIGWPKLGDLSEVEVRDKYVIMSRFKDVGYYKSTNQNVISRKAGEIYDFYKNINIGDIVLAQEGHGVLAIGIVRDDYSFDPKKDFPHQKSVEWLLYPDGFINGTGPNTTVYQITDKNIIKTIEQFLVEKAERSKSTNHVMKHPLNQILYGPPGTGKTFNTVNRAISIIDSTDEKTLMQTERDLLKKRFEELVRKGQIVFTTFHQSMSYEDFIEGIKPIEPKDDDLFLKYETQDGIFLKVCIEATYNYIKRNFPENEQESQIRTFNQLYDQLFEDVEQAGEKSLATLNGNNVLASVTDQGNFSVKHLNGTRTYTVSRNRLAPLFEQFDDLSEINNIHEEFRNVIGGCNSTAFWSVLNAIKNLQSDTRSKRDIPVELKYEDKKSIVKSYWKNSKGKPTEDEKSEPFVIIIDEINRGNVSQIFGELITLIEEDKRLGKSEALEVKLPYSKESFGVPPNVYIIGTMNTADRSVEALDTALRRRFSFEEMPPKYELEELDGEVFGYPLHKILKAINLRIEKLLDRDHAIGHSYFLNKTNDTIVESFYRCIIPLLQEYFFGDYGKIGLVLGDGFINSNGASEQKRVFADFEYDGKDDFEERQVFHIIDYRTAQGYTLKVGNQTVEMDFETAIKRLMNDNIV